MEKQKKERKILKKLVFASADIMGGGTFNIINFLYTGFIALVIGLNPFWAGLIMLVAKIWDAIVDPIIGLISDRTSSKFGKRRIYMLIAAPFIIVSLFFLFFPFNIDSVALRVILCLTSYLLFTIVQSLVMVPYFSLASEISSDYKERGSYNSFRMGFSILSSIVCVALPGIIVDALPNNQGYIVMALVFGTIFAISAIITALFTKEEIVTPPIKKKVNLKNFLKPLKVKPYRQYLYLYLTTQMCMAIMSGLFFFYIDFYVVKDITAAGDTSIVGMIAAALMFGMQIVALPFYMWLIKKKGKMFVFQVGAAIWILSAISLIFIPANINPIVIYIVASIMGFGISGPGLIPHAMLGDVVDYGQFELKERLDGQMGGFGNFVNQISQAIGLALAMFIIGLAGFKEQDLSLPTITSQTDGAMLSVRLIMALAPLIIMSIAMAISFTYKIDEKKHHEVLLAIKNEEEKAEVQVN